MQVEEEIEYVPIALRIPETMDDRLKGIAKARLLNKSDVIREAVLVYLAKLDEDAATLREAKAN